MSPAWRHGEQPGELRGELLDLALGIAREAGALVLERRSGGVSVAATKSSATDLVTEADRASEQLIRDRITAARPDDAILGEEGDDVPGTSGLEWVVDPIDGTVNYVLGLPAYAVSIAVRRGGEMLAGVVLNPATGAEYVASRGHGATCDGVPLRVRQTADPARMVVATGFSYDPGVRGAQAAAVARLLPQVADIRRSGSCALDLCALAAGQLDAYVEEGVMPWDHAAAGLIAREAGAELVVLRGASGRDLVLACGDAGFAGFRALVRRCGFTAG